MELLRSVLPPCGGMWLWQESRKALSPCHCYFLTCGLLVLAKARFGCLGPWVLWWSPIFVQWLDFAFWQSSCTAQWKLECVAKGSGNQQRSKATKGHERFRARVWKHLRRLWSILRTLLMSERFQMVSKVVWKSWGEHPEDFVGLYGLPGLCEMKTGHSGHLSMRQHCKKRERLVCCSWRDEPTRWRRTQKAFRPRKAHVPISFQYVLMFTNVPCWKHDL